MDAHTSLRITLMVYSYTDQLVNSYMCDVQREVESAEIFVYPRDLAGLPVTV
jgi:hypothetical protein